MRAFDDAGEALWTEQFGTESDDQAQSVTISDDGFIYASGRIGANFSNQQVLVAGVSPP